MKLTESQQTQYDYIINCIEDAVHDKTYAQRIISLEGPAGSGKTTLSAEIIHKILGKYTIKVTATTHKALKVLRDMLKLPDDVKTSTIHSHLALKMKTDYSNGSMFLEPDNSKPVPRVQVLFVDESSMASKDLFKYIEQSVDRRQAKIVIFIGDEYQLLPVEGGHNPVYKLNYRYKLTEVVRQASDNPIIQLASEIRKDIEHQKFRSATELLQLFRKFEGTNIIIPKDKNEFFNLLFTDIENKDKFISTYTNEAMKNYNYFCRNIVKNQPKDDYIVGDEVVFLEHHSVGDDIIHVNNEIVKIQKCNKVEYFLAPTIKYWECQDEGGEWFNVVANDSSYEWNKFLNQLSQYAKTAPKDKKREAWKDFFGHKNFMSKVAFTYAGTVHKSQGSSFDEGYVDVDEILRAWKYQESDMIFRLLYVACTRPKDKLILKINI